MFLREQASDWNRSLTFAYSHGRDTASGRSGCRAVTYRMAKVAIGGGGREIGTGSFSFASRMRVQALPIKEIRGTVRWCGDVWLGVIAAAPEVRAASLSSGAGRLGVARFGSSH